MIELNKKTQQDFLNREWVQKLLDAGVENAPKAVGKDKNSSIGRRLDFIVQEMNREANTTLSKSDSLAVTDIGLNMKILI